MANEIKNSIVTGAKQQSSVTSALGRLTKREQTMIYALIIVGAICALAFLVVVPGLERIQTLNNEAAQAEEQRQEYITVIAQGQGTEEIIAEAQVRYDNAKEKLFSQMMPEAIDTTVTKYLVKAGFDPQTLGMSPLTPEEVAQFTPQPLNGDPIPEPPVDQVAPAEDPAAAPAEAESSAAPAEGQPAPEEGQAAPEEGQTDPAESPAEPPADQDVQEEASATSLGGSAENRNGANGGAVSNGGGAANRDGANGGAVSNGGKASIGGGMASAHPWDGSIFLTVYADDIVAEGATTDDVAAGDASTDEVAEGGTTTDDIAAGDASTDEVAEGGTTTDDIAAEEASADDIIPLLSDDPLTDTVYTGGSVYSYSVNVTAQGGWSNLYKLINKIAKVDGVEIMQYSYSESTDEENVDDGSFTMTIKFYVFVQGAPADAVAATDGAQAQ